MSSIEVLCIDTRPCQGLCHFSPFILFRVDKKFCHSSVPSISPHNDEKCYVVNIFYVAMSLHSYNIQHFCWCTRWVCRNVYSNTSCITTGFWGTIYIVFFNFVPFGDQFVLLSSCFFVLYGQE